MKLTPALKSSLIALGFQVMFGQMNDLQALSTALKVLASEADLQLAAQKPS